MLEGPLTGEQEEPRERACVSTDEGATRLRMVQAGQASGDRNSKPEKNR